LQSDVRESTLGGFKCSVVQNFLVLARIVPARTTMDKDFFDFCVTKLGYAVAVDRNPRFCRLITNRRDILAEYAESAPGPTYDSVLRANYVTVRLSETRAAAFDAFSLREAFEKAKARPLAALPRGLRATPESGDDSDAIPDIGAADPAPSASSPSASSASARATTRRVSGGLTGNVEPSNQTSAPVTLPATAARQARRAAPRGDAGHAEDPQERDALSSEVQQLKQWAARATGEGNARRHFSTTAPPHHPRAATTTAAPQPLPRGPDPRFQVSPLAHGPQIGERGLDAVAADERILGSRLAAALRSPTRPALEVLLTTPELLRFGSPVTQARTLKRRLEADDDVAAELFPASSRPSATPEQLEALAEACVSMDYAATKDPSAARRRDAHAARRRLAEAVSTLPSRKVGHLADLAIQFPADRMISVTMAAAARAAASSLELSSARVRAPAQDVGSRTTMDHGAKRLRGWLDDPGPAAGDDDDEFDEDAPHGAGTATHPGEIFAAPAALRSTLTPDPGQTIAAGQAALRELHTKAAGARLSRMVAEANAVAEAYSSGMSAVAMTEDTETKLVEVYSAFRGLVGRCQGQHRIGGWLAGITRLAVPDGTAQLSHPAAREAIGNVMHVVIGVKVQTPDAWRKWAMAAPRGQAAATLWRSLLVRMATLTAHDLAATLAAAGSVPEEDMVTVVRQAAVACGAVLWVVARAAASHLLEAATREPGAVSPRDVAVFRLARLGGAAVLVTEGSTRGDESCSHLARWTKAFLREATPGPTGASSVRTAAEARSAAEPSRAQQRKQPARHDPAGSAASAPASGSSSSAQLRD